VGEQCFHGVLHAHDPVFGELGRFDEKILALSLEIELESRLVHRREYDLGRQLQTFFVPGGDRQQHHALHVGLEGDLGS
jgi:hypothetical protein